MQVLIIFFLIAFVVVASLLWNSSYSFDEPDAPLETEADEMTTAMLYNLKYHERPPVYLDPHFGSAS